MLYERTAVMAVAVAALVPNVWAGQLGLIHEIQGTFKMGNFPRQDQQILQVGQFQVGLAANLNTFSEALGGAGSPPITHSSDTNHPFAVDSDTVSDFETATNKACDAQKNDCANLANGRLKGKFKVSDCDEQRGRYPCLPAVYGAFGGGYRLYE